MPTFVNSYLSALSIDVNIVDFRSQLLPTSRVMWSISRHKASGQWKPPYQTSEVSEDFGSLLVCEVWPVAQQHITDDSLDNLALACPDCNRHKGPNLTTLDLPTREIVRLFHPRQDQWTDHFEFRGAILIGRSVVGEATIRLLQINTVDRVEMRAVLQAAEEM